MVRHRPWFSQSPPPIRRRQQTSNGTSPSHLCLFATLAQLYLHLSPDFFHANLILLMLLMLLMLLLRPRLLLRQQRPIDLRLGLRIRVVSDALSTTAVGRVRSKRLVARNLVRSVKVARV